MCTAVRFAFSIGFVAIALVATSGTSVLAARTCNAASGGGRVALLELYTSEGCDSCPPADKWVSGLAAKQLGPDRLVTLGFHVDYWNHIGWIDPYAQARFSERQRQQATRRGASFVFTPQLLLNGNDYRRGWVFDDIGNRVKAVNQSKPLADIKLALTSDGPALASVVDASVKAVDQRGAQLYLALQESNLVNDVTAGENRGRKLTHDFVVRELVGPITMSAGHVVRHEHLFRLQPHWKARDLRVAAFVQNPQTGEVLQALATACP